jgi:hypothetical protein
VAHAPSHQDAAAHGHDGDHAEYVDAAELAPPDEGKTPLWLTALGGGLFLLLAVAWLAARPAALTLSELTPPAPPAEEVPAAPAPAPQPPPAQPAAVAPAPTPAPMMAPAPAAAASGKGSKVPAAKLKHKKPAADGTP